MAKNDVSSETVRRLQADNDRLRAVVQRVSEISDDPRVTRVIERADDAR